MSSSNRTSCETCVSAPVHMVRNFSIRNGFPPAPARSCEKNTGPRLPSLIETATSTNSGATTINRVAENRMSKARFNTIVERETSHVSNSSIGMSATSVIRDAGSALPRREEMAVSLTWCSLQRVRNSPMRSSETSSGATMIRWTSVARSWNHFDLSAGPPRMVDQRRQPP